MESFDFNLPTKIYCGNGSFQNVAEHIKEGNRIFIVSDPGIEKLGFVDKLLQQLENYDVKVFTNVKPNPKDTDCIEGGNSARDFDADYIIALGGGSVIDAAKAIAVLQVHGKRPQDFAGRGQVPSAVKPIIAIPTTAGTGAEVTRSSVITDTVRKIKFTIKDVNIAPVVAIVDPELTYGLPAPLTASTGMDALVHAIEAFTCKRANPVSDGLAIQAIKHIYPNLRKAVEDGSNKEARYHMMIGSTIAGMAFSHADVASVHCMAEAIGGLYDTPHGVANSMFLPYVIEYNAMADIKKHATIARTMGIVKEKATDEEATIALVEEMKQLAKDILIPSFASLKEINIADFNYLATSSFENGSTQSNAREITHEDYLQLFNKAYAEK
ncbi:iron-containing alcohol dehydrogenase [Paenisporosarcina sp. TG20]|uniref:iron-containing alcohol dehydrogenase n=1 Tax=Paenisporosarcina sp. TG20 TaxID=1211706 RepID=UPI0002FB8CAF|nr:iron-containing alcohol dehydrogenase [Paenisporosarcina sp. TG20]